MAYDQIITKWRKEAQLLEKKALQLDAERDGFCSKYYSAMTDEEKNKFNELTSASHQLYIERNCLNRCVAELESERDFQEKNRWKSIFQEDLI
jgi:hypothetical protein